MERQKRRQEWKEGKEVPKGRSDPIPRELEGSMELVEQFPHQRRKWEGWDRWKVASWV